MTILALIVLSMILVIPALLVVGVAPRFVAARELNGRRVWILILLLVAAGLLLVTSFYARSFGSGDWPVVLLWLFPMLEGVLALIIINWRDILDVWKLNKLWITAILLALLFLLISLGRFISIWYAPLIVTLPALLMASAWMIGRKAKETALVLLAIITSIYLLLDAAGLISNHAVMGDELFRSVYSLVGAIVIGIALAVSSLLVYRALTNERSKRYLTPAVILLFSLAATEIRHGMVVDATGRAPEDHFPFFTILVSILAGMLVASQYKGPNRIRGLAYLVLVPTLIISSYAFGWLINPQAITTARADRLANAIESYHEKNGVFPADLATLTPQYVPIILGPLTGKGQIWCYQAGQDYYRLGYAYYQRYYYETNPTPFYEIKVPHSTGELPPGPWICDDELERNQQRLGL